MFFDPAVDGLKPPPLTHNVYAALVVPRPIGWISTISRDGVVNLSPFSFFNMVSNNPMCVVFCANGWHNEGGKKDSVVNAEETGEFVYNACDASLVQEMNATSANLPRSVDEMIAAGLEPEPSKKVKPPRVKASKIHLECKYLHTVQLPPGPDGSPNCTVFGQVVGINIDDEILTDGMIDWQKYKPLGRLGYLDYGAITDTFAVQRPK